MEIGKQRKSRIHFICLFFKILMIHCNQPFPSFLLHMTGKKGKRHKSKKILNHFQSYYSTSIFKDIILLYILYITESLHGMPFSFSFSHKLQVKRHQNTKSWHYFQTYSPSSFKGVFLLYILYSDVSNNRTNNPPYTLLLETCFSKTMDHI